VVNTAEFKVGLVTLTSTIFFIGMIIFVSGNNPLKQTAFYDVTFDEAGLLQKGDQVRINGIPIGEVTKIGLSSTGKVDVKIRIDASIKLRKDTKIVIGDVGLFGTNYIKVTQSYDSKVKGIWEPGATIPGANEPGFEELLNEGHELVVQLKTTFASLNQIVSDEAIHQDIKGVFSDLKASTAKTKTMFDSMEIKVNRTLDDVNSITTTLKYDAATSGTAVVEAVEKLNSILADLDSIASRNSKNIDNAINNITSMIDDFDDDGKTVDDVKKMIDNLKEVSTTLKTFASDISAGGTTAERIRNITEKAETATSDLAEMTTEVKDFVLDPETKEDIKQAFEDVNSLASNVDTATSKIKDIKFKLQAAVYHSTGDSNFRSDFWGQIENDKFLFRLGFEDINEDNGINTVQVGVKFNNFTFRTGLIQDEFGVGTDYKFGSRDTFRMTLEGFNPDEFTWRAAGSLKIHKGTRLAVWHQRNSNEHMTYSGLQQEF